MMKLRLIGTYRIEGIKYATITIDDGDELQYPVTIDGGKEVIVIDGVVFELGSVIKG